MTLSPTPDHPALAAFIAEANSRMGKNYHAGFLSLQPLLSKLVFGTDFLAHLTRTEVCAVHRDPTHESMFWEAEHILVAQGPLWQLRVGPYRQSAQYLYTSPFHMIIAVRGPTALVADMYDNPVVDNDVFDRRLRLGEPRRHRYEVGDVIVVDTRKDILDVVVTEPVVAVKLISAKHDALQWAFDRTTRLAIEAVAAEPADSELVSLARALASLEREEATPALLELAEHPRHFVRWSAVQALARVAPNLAYDALRRAAKDPHPHVRNAAINALAHLPPPQG